MLDLMLALYETEQAIVESYKRNDKALMYVAYSGGSDSALVMDIAIRVCRHHNISLKAMSIDTGIACDGWHAMVQSHCDALSIDLEIVKGKHAENWYIESAGNFGFGYTPATHTVYYRMLKQDAIQKHIRETKRHHHDRIVYITGVRRAESVRRSKTETEIRHGCRVTLNAIAHWSDALKSEYLDRYCTWWRNTYYDVVGNSGDCQCNWTCANSLKDLEVYPKLHGIVSEAERRSIASGLNRYGVRLDEHTAMNAIDDMPVDSLCINCYQKKLL